MMKFFFDGGTYRSQYDYDRLKNGVQRVFWILLDGKWHGTNELRDRVMPSGDSRARDLRKPWYGTMEVPEEIDPATNMGKYRLLLDSVEEEWARKILENEIKIPKGSPLPNDPDEILDLLHSACAELVKLDDIKHAHNTYRNILKKIESHKTPLPQGGPPPGHSDCKTRPMSEVGNRLIRRIRSKLGT
jgi:hypothetical protein